MMEKKFKRLSDHKVVDLIPYLKEKMANNVKIYIGADSQNLADSTNYATVIVLHYGNSGGHVLYYKETLPRVRNQFNRLWKEVEDSIEVAMYLADNGIQRATYIDLDLNPDPKYQSNTVLRAAMGYVESMGFTPRIKPNAAAASCCADHLLH
jgi:predicted RNase H-related nuclease YkuK (DUF458 family)